MSVFFFDISIYSNSKGYEFDICPEGSWLTLSDDDWGVFHHQKAFFFRFHETILSFVEPKLSHELSTDQRNQLEQIFPPAKLRPGCEVNDQQQWLRDFGANQKGGRGCEVPMAETNKTLHGFGQGKIDDKENKQKNSEPLRIGKKLSKVASLIYSQLEVPMILRLVP